VVLGGAGCRVAHHLKARTDVGRRHGAARRCGNLLRAAMFRVVNKGIASAPTRDAGRHIEARPSGRHAVFGQQIAVVVVGKCRVRNAIDSTGDARHLMRPGVVHRFLNQLQANLEHRSRYRLVLVRTFEYLRDLGLKTDNPALGLFEDDFLTSRNKSMAFLTRQQRSDLLDTLQPDPWRKPDLTQQQDLALTSLLFGAGLKVGEALRCTVNCIDLSDSSGWVDLPAPIAIRSHRAMLLADARPPLQHWVEQASSRGPLFPSQRVRSKGRAMDAASAFRAVLRVCSSIESMSESAQRISPQTLRNTYLAIMVDQQHSAALITEYLGFSRPSSAHRAIEAYQNWQIGDRSKVRPKANRGQMPLL
jgi:integrase